MEVSLCPLSPIKLQDLKWELRDLLDMEEHIATQPNCLHPQLKTWVLPEPLEGSTPLLMACSKGNLDAVKRIVEHWQSDINATGVYHVFKHQSAKLDKKILETSPLFVAAYRNDLEVVRYLVENGANVFAKTSDHNDVHYLAGLTPLYGSFASTDLTVSTRQHLDAIVRLLLESAGSNPSTLLTTNKFKTIPVWMLVGCAECDGPEVTITLIKYGMTREELNERCIWEANQTILQHWASKSLCYIKNGSQGASILELVQLLVEKGIDVASANFFGHTPIFLSVAPGNVYRNPPSLNFSVFDFLLESEEIGRLDKINSLELAGAVILSFSTDATQVPLAFTYWRRAHHLRYLVGANPIPKTPILFKNVPQRVEWTTLSQLEEIENNPSQHKITALLVHLRILSVSDNWPYSYTHLHKRPVDLAVYHHEEGLHQGFAEAVDSFLIALEFEMRNDPRRPYFWQDIVVIVEKLVTLLKKNLHRCTSEMLKKSVELISASHLPDASRTYINILHLKTLLRFVKIFANHPDKMNNGIMNSLAQLVRHDRRTEDGLNLLLVACGMVLLRYKDLTPTIRLLLQAQANPNAVDLRFNGPLHILASLKSANQERLNQLGNLLVGNGAHPYMVDDEGRTAADIWLLVRNQGPQQEDHRVLDCNDLPDWCLEDVQELKCYSATIVRRFQIPYVDEVPATLYPFMEKH